LGRGLLASGGALPNKLGAIQTALQSNTKAQARVTDQATLYEARIRKQYSSLDAQMAQLNALNAYVTQQVTTWNKSSA
jgi:flagellar hook-associated protein 2